MKKRIENRRSKKGFLWVLLLLLLLLGAAFLFFHSKYRLMQKTGQPTETVQTQPAPAVDEDEQVMQQAIKQLEEMESVEAQGEVADDRSVFNILLIGTDERTPQFNTNARGDSCMLFSVSKKTGDYSLVSFERGTGVPILEGEYEGQWDWLTHTFRYGGAQLMMREIEECYKIDVDGYVRINFNTFITGIDTIGGVDIDLTEAESEYLNTPGHFGKDFADRRMVQATTAGRNHLNGDTALLYARCRQIDNDWGRVVRQRKVVKAALEQVKGLSVRQLNTLLDTVLPLVETDLTEGDIIGLMAAAPKVLKGEMQQTTIPLQGTYGSMVGMGGRSLFSVDFDANAKYLQELLYGKQ